jgi:hypothetical protein
MVRKAHKSHGTRSRLYGGRSNGVSPISVSVSIATFQSRNAGAPLRLLRHPRKRFLKRLYLRFREVGGGGRGERKRCTKCIACQGRYCEKETVTAPPQSSDS